MAAQYGYARFDNVPFVDVQEISFASVQESGAVRNEKITSQDVSVQGCSGDYPHYCGGDCWKCNSPSDVFTCYNGNAYCCPSSYPYYCSRTGSCWKNSDECNKAQTCGNEGWTVCRDTNYPHWNCKSDGQSICCQSGYPYYCSRTSNCWKDSNQCNNAVWCNGQWSACTPGTYKPNCVNNNVHCCPSDKPNYVNGQCTKCPADKPIECGGNCYSSSDCGGYEGLCTSKNEFVCCLSGYTYPCPRTDLCWSNKEKCDTAINCGGNWWACNDPNDNEKCVDGKGGCCPSGYSYYCPSANTCFKEDGLCDGRPVYNCNSKLWVCLKKEDKGTCYGNELRCCPQSYQYWWESDKQCHASPYQQKACSFPDGSSAECDCNSNSDCPASKPYCEENYPSPISDGYDACLASEPEYCGNGKCAGNEDYNSCAQDCSSSAPKGNINVDVTYSKGANANKPIPGAYVYLDGTLKGTTGSDGKKSFEAGYGQHTVKVNCPDSSSCESRTVSVDGTKYSGFACNCNPLGDSDGDGDSDEDEKLLGTDPNNANENYASVFSPANFKYPKSCIDAPAMLKLVWDNKDNIVQSHQEVLSALNITEVTSANLEEKPSVLLQALSQEKLDAKIELAPQNSTLKEAFGTAEYVDGFFTEHGAIIIVTDNGTSSTAIIAVSAVCVGNFVGLLYGAGTGIKDDVVGIGELLKGIWYMLTTDTSKLASDVTDFITSIPQLLQSKDKIFHDMLTGILGNGRDVTEKTGLFKSDRDQYLRFQIGFVTGFVSGYVAEQIATLVLGPKKILDGLRKGQLIVGRIGKTAKLPALLVEKITGEFGQEASTILTKLKYAGKIADWTEAEQKGIARMAKLNGDNWLKKLSAEEAKLASGPVNTLALRGVPDSSLQKLLETDMGRKTLLLTEVDYGLLSKQAKLAEKWGSKQLDEVAKRFDGNWPWQKDGWKKVNKFLSEVPESALDGKVKETALINVLGAKDFDKVVDTLKNLKRADGTYIPGVDRVVKQMLENPDAKAYEGFSDQLFKADELKRADKIVEELEVPLKDPKTGSELTRADIKYTSNGVTKYIEHKNWHWPSKTQGDIKDVADQLKKYHNALGDWNKIRLSSRNPIPQSVIEKLKVELGDDAVKKILGVE